MSKVLKIAAVVVAVAAITVATGGLGTAPAVGAAGSVTATAAATTALGTTIAGATVTMGAASLGAASILGLSAGALMAISSGLSLASGLMARPPNGAASGIQTDWSADPQAGVPYAVGRTYTAGNIVHRVGYGGAENPYQTVVTVYTCAGPIESFNTIQADRAIMTFDGAGNAVGAFHDYMYFKTQLGAQPAAAALTGPFGAIPGWSAASKLSGMAASIWTGKFDTKGKVWPNGQELKMGVVGAWVKVYDPRKDSTYPGGSGAHRWNDESTWEWSANPWLHGLTWAIGRHSNGKRTVGVGMPMDGIDVAAYVNAANVAYVNSWDCGGVVWSTDDKWDVMKRFAQAGGGEPVRAAATLSCFVNAPKVSLATITQADLADGQVSVTAMQSRRERINGVVPRFRSEAHDWEIVSGDPVRVDAYVTEDGEQRTKETDLILVQDARQGAQLAAYEVVNGREFGPIEIPLKPAWMVFKVGDCLTLDLPDVGLNGQSAIVINRKLDPGTGVFTLVMRSETTAKHDFALGRTAVAPPTPAISDRPGVPAAPGAGAWTLAGASLTNAGTSLPALELTGLADNSAADAIIVEIRKDGDTAWDAVGTLDAATTRKLISDGIASATAYEVAISYRVRGVVGEQLVLGPMTSGALSAGSIPFKGEFDDSGYLTGDIVTSGGAVYIFRTDWPASSGAPTLGTEWDIFVPAPDPGGSARVAELSARSQVVAAGADGTVGSFAGIGGTMVLRDGASDVTSGVAYSVVSASGMTIAINASTGIYAPSAMASDTAIAILRAAYDGHVYDAVYTLAKAKSGADGTLAWTPIFDPADWQRGGGTLTAITTAYFDQSKVIASRETVPMLSVSWTVQAVPKPGALGITDGSITYSLYTYTGSSDLLVMRNIGQPDQATLKNTGGYLAGERLTVVHRGTYIQFLRAGVEVHRVSGVSPTSAWRAWGISGVPGVSFEDVALSVVGDAGAPGLSIAELTVYRRATSAPATPTGGSYNFATKVLTPPSGWSATFPAGTDPVYAASGAASIVGQTGTAAPAWLGVGKVAQDGATGLDGVATNIVFRRSATQPATPAASAGTPASWYDATGSVPAGADPIWASFGTRPNASANYTWQIAKKLEGQDGVSPIQVDVLPSPVSIRGDAGGAAYSTLLPVVAQIVVRQGTTILTPTSVTIPSGGKVACDGTVSTTTVTITSVSDTDGSLSFDVAAAGQTVRAKFVYSVTADGSPGATSASFTRSSPQITSASYVDYGAAMAINADGSGNLKLTFTGSAKAPDGGDLILQSKWQIQPAGGARTDISGSEKTSTQSQWTTDPDRQSAAQFGTSVYNLTGLTPGGAYLFYFMVRKTLTTWSNSATCDFRAMVERPS